MEKDSVEDLRLPQTVIGRLVKEALPSGVVVSKEARTAIARAAAVFILHAATYAQESAISNKRKTVTAVDILNAIKVLECSELEKPVKEALELWKTNKQQKSEARKRKAERTQNTDSAQLETSKADVQMDGVSSHISDLSDDNVAMNVKEVNTSDLKKK
ncbi:unnamed protein product [Thelazia callipaeda]|uniref:DNA polymerase epsilon subunit 3 n=1 Tax=Thelazia callipaeda TaxID=103827 RepID=A0A0N5CS43_THECL|nr:unnamed protein product [Thelazia callipaeda]